MRHTTLSHLSDAELLAHVDNTRDSMTETTVEIELAQRLEARLADDDLVAPLKAYDAADSQSITDIAELIDEFGGVSGIRTRLELITRVQKVAEALDEGAISDLNNVLSEANAL